MARAKKFRAEEVVAALRATKGMVYLAAEKLGCDPKTIYNYRDNFASVKAEMTKQDGIITDTAELKLVQAIHNGEPWSIKYRLSTKGKDRGYVERQEISGKDGGPVETKATVTHGIDGNTATTIFDILERIGVLPTAPHDAKDDQVHTASTDA